MVAPSVEEIAEYNPWVRKENFEVPLLKRKRYEEIKNEIKRSKFIIGIVGIRRIGKTILMKQIGNEIEGEKFFFSFDEEAYQNIESLKFVISHFLKISKTKPHIFLDEVGRIKGWAGVIKKYHDLGKANFIVSSSSYLQLTKGKESLAGRLKDFNLMPWNFEEYLKLKNKEVVAVNDSNLERAYTAFKNDYRDDIRDYLKKGAFPEIIDEGDEFQIKKYVKNSTVEKLVFEDLPRIFPIEHADKVHDILIHIVKNNGSILNYSNIGGMLQLSKDTVKRYIFYLEQSLIINSLPLYGSYTKALRKGKKYYSSCPPISFAYQEYYNEPNLVENAVLNKLQEYFGNLRFYRDSVKREVDFIVNNIPIEVKWKSDISSEDLKNVLFFMKKYKLKKGIIVAKKFSVIERNSKKIYILPLEFFLLLDLTKIMSGFLK